MKSRIGAIAVTALLVVGLLYSVPLVSASSLSVAGSSSMPLTPKTTTQLRVNCGSGAYSTIDSAVAAANPGDTVVVCPGTYNEQVIVPVSIVLKGIGGPVINATGFDTGVTVLASGTTVEGFTIENATGEGILVVGSPGSPISDVTIQRNVVINNDLGNPILTGMSSSYQECNPAPNGIPGDCGEGIHLMVAKNSVVRDNMVSGNSGGILLTDEFGPTFGNLLEYNNITGNTFDCGVTLAGHNTGAYSVTDGPQPLVGGVFNNVVLDNFINNNGVNGEGGGVLMATGGPGGAVYDNVIEGNHIAGNGLSGVTVHSHAPGQDLNGSVIVGNHIGTNNLDGDYDFGVVSPSFVDPSTTGVFVASVGPLNITISNNHIKNDHYGIWMMPTVIANGLSSNHFVGVTTAIEVPLPPP